MLTLQQTLSKLLGDSPSESWNSLLSCTPNENTKGYVFVAYKKIIKNGNLWPDGEMLFDTNIDVMLVKGDKLDDPSAEYVNWFFLPWEDLLGFYIADTQLTQKWLKAFVLERIIMKRMMHGGLRVNTPVCCQPRYKRLVSPMIENRTLQTTGVGPLIMATRYANCSQRTLVDDAEEIRLANNVLQAVFDLEMYRRKTALDELAKSLESATQG